MFCKKCGSFIEDDARFCPKCGADQKEGQESDISLPTISAQPKYEGRVDVKKFSFIAVLLLGILTCGIYHLYFLYRTTEDYNQLADKYKEQRITSFFVAFLLSFVTCGIYMIYWIYKYMELAINIATKKGARLTVSSPAIFLIIYLFIPIFPIYLMTEVNNACAEGEGA